MKTLILAAALAAACCCSLSAQTTTVTGTLRTATNDPVTGSCDIQAVTSFSTPGGARVVRGPRVTVPFLAGALSVALVPTDTASPGPSYYLVDCSSRLQIVNGRTLQPYTWPEKTWTVPTSGSPVDISSGRIEVSPAPQPPILIAPSQINAHSLADGLYCLQVATGLVTGLSSQCGGGGTWGSITGTLSAQTDLATALALKAPLAAPVFTGQPTIPDFTLAPHTHQNTAGGGTLDAAAIATGVLALARIPAIPESGVTNLTADLAGKAASNASTAVNGQSCVLGSTCTVTAAPSAHAATHASGGSDPVTLTEAQITNLTTDLAAKLGLHAKADTAGAADTAAALASAPTLCSAGQFPLGIDAAGNAQSCTVASSAGSVLTTVTFSATPTYAVSTSAVQMFRIVLTGNITSATLTTTLATQGQVIAFEFCQDATGGRTVVQPTNLLGAGAVDTTASACSKQSFLWDSVSSNAIASSGMVSDVATPGIITSAGTLTLPTAPDTLVGRASTDTLTNKTISGASNTLTVREADLSISDNTTANVSTAKHGFAPKAPNDATKFLDGTGAYSVPVSSGYNAFDTTFFPIIDETFCSAGNANGSIVESIGRENWLSYLPTGAGTQLSVTNSANTDRNHPCGITLKAPASINNGEGLILAANATSARTSTSAVYTVAGFQPMEFQWQVKLSSTSNIRAYVSFANNSSVPSSAVQGCGIRYDTTLSDTTWVGFCGDATTWATTTISGGLDSTGIHRLRMWQTAQGTVNFSVDGGTTASVSSKIPTGTTNIAPSIIVQNDGTSTTSALDLFRAVGKITGLVVN